MTLTTFNASVFCSKELTKGLHKQLICISMVNIVFAFTSIAANTLILLALPKVTLIHPPSKILLRNLVVSDLAVGVVEVTIVIYWISMVQEWWQVCRDFFFAHLIASTILVPASLWTITAISVDRLLALLLGLRYRQVVTVKRVYMFLIAFWVSFGIAVLAIGLSSNIAWRIFMATIILLCVIISIYCYSRIFFRLRHHQSQAQAQTQEQANERVSLNMTRYKKTLSTTMWLQLALVICFFPYGALSSFAFREIDKKRSSGFFLALYVTVTLMFFNSTLNPILYCWKMNEVRQAVKETLRQLFCSPDQ
ncbi:melanocyte-stimulating hormone receptor-like [Montipora capricornis]|uniref:melanocyte-stimulating hormone receptor-like n=1 Tax=Montipora capricornis TaxID=246305 RepID=UPI0035F1ADF0